MQRKKTRILHGRDRTGFESHGEADSTVTIYNFMYRNRTRFDPAAFLPFTDTIIYEHHFPVWLFTFGMSSSGPSISRVNGKECHTSVIFELFTKGKNCGTDVVAVFATVEKIGVQYDYACHYVDRDHLLQFLLEPPEHGILQKFVVPHGIHNDEVRVHWTPNFVSSERWENRYQWKDTRINLQMRLCCHIGAAACREVSTSPDQMRVVEKKMNTFMEQTLKFEKKEIRSIVFHLKLDSNGSLHFLWISSADIFNSHRLKAQTNFRLNDPRALQALTLEPLKNKPSKAKGVQLLRTAALDEAQLFSVDEPRENHKQDREEEFLELEEKSIGSSSSTSSSSGVAEKETATAILKRLTTANTAKEQLEAECEDLKLPGWVFETLGSEEETCHEIESEEQSSRLGPKHSTKPKPRKFTSPKKKDMLIMRFGRSDFLTEYLRDVITSKKEEAESSYEMWLRSCNFRESKSWKFEAVSKTDTGNADWLAALRKKNRQRSLSLKSEATETPMMDEVRRKRGRSFRLASQLNTIDKSARSLAEELGVEVGVTFNVERHDATDVFNPNPLFCDSDDDNVTSHILYPGTYAREAVEEAANHFPLPHSDFSILKDKFDLVTDEYHTAMECLKDCEYQAYSSIIEDHTLVTHSFELPRALFKVQWYTALLSKLAPGFEHTQSTEFAEHFTLTVKRKGELMALSTSVFGGLLEETERRYENTRIKLFFPHYENNPLNKRPQWSQYLPVAQSMMKRARKRRRNFARDTFSSASFFETPTQRGSFSDFRSTIDAPTSPLHSTSSRVRFRRARHSTTTVSSASSDSSDSERAPDEPAFHPDRTLEALT